VATRPARIRPTNAGGRHFGDHARAWALLEESLATWEVLGNRGGVSRDLRNLARLALTEGDLAQAGRLFEQSLSMIWEAKVSVLMLVLVLEGFAGLAAARGHARQALRLAGAAAAWRAREGLHLWVGEQPELDRWLAPARAVLGHPAAAAAGAEGEPLTVERAPEEALDAASH
jgi:hypothetical protein